MRKYHVDPGVISMVVEAASHEDAVRTYFRTREHGPLTRGEAIGLEVRPKDDWRNVKNFGPDECIKLSCEVSGDKPWLDWM